MSSRATGGPRRARLPAVVRASRPHRHERLAPRTTPEQPHSDVPDLSLPAPSPEVSLRPVARPSPSSGAGVPPAPSRTVSMSLVVSTKQPFLVVHFRREAAGALQGRCHRSPGQATPKAERRPGWSAIFARVPRPLWPQSAKLTGAKEAMELIDCCGNFALRPIVAGLLGRPFRALFGWDFYPGQRALRALALGYLRAHLRC